MLDSTMKYIAIKPNGFSYWIWFERENVKRESGTFIGKDGWGLGGACTSIKINESDISGEMSSTNLQYR